MLTEKIKSTAVRELYALPQPAGLVAVREYLLTEVDGCRVLILRWIKEAEFAIDSMTFEVTMLDAVGGELGRVTVTHLASDIPPAETGHILTPDRGISVDGGCMDIRVRLTEVRSGSYIYRPEGAGVTVDYTAEEPWRYDAHAGEHEGLTDSHPLRVRSKRSGKVRFLWPVALLTVLLIAGFVLYPYLSDLFPSVFG